MKGLLLTGGRAEAWSMIMWKENDMEVIFNILLLHLSFYQI